MRDFFSRLSLSDKAVPFILLSITVVSFGLLIPWLGFYWDDWPVIYMAKTQGTAGFWAFYQYDRPFSAWTYIVFAPILGTHPLAWQIFTLLLRWLTAVLVWASLRMIWPKRPHQVFWVALLFAVSPIFTQQFISVAYSQHWICYLLYFGSVYFMLGAQENRQRFHLFTALAVLLSLLEMLSMEYFLGLELLRPLILWFYYREKEPGSSLRSLARRVAGSAWLYGLAFTGYVIWRMFFLRLAEPDPNRPRLLEELLHTPLQAIVSLTQKAIQDFVYLLTSWLVGFRPADIDLSRPFSLAALVIAVSGAVLGAILMSRYRPLETKENEGAWPLRAMFLGVAAMLLGTLPIWSIGRQISIGPLGGRFSLAAMFGLSLLLVGFLEWLSTRTKAKLTVIGLLIGVAIHTNLYTAKAYQEAWDIQRTFYWQLAWRAPYISPQTAFISDGEIFVYMGLYSTSMGISLLYPPVEQPTHVPYWFFTYTEGLFRIPNELIAGTVLEEGIRNYSFSGDSKDAIVMEFYSDLHQCLHLDSARDQDNRDLRDPIRRLLVISNLGRVKPEPLNNWRPPASIYGPEPKHTWCYYFEKADLAYQYEDWPEVIRLMKEAEARGFAPKELKEYLPLLDAYLQTNDFEKAVSLSLQMQHSLNKIDDRICNLWVGASKTQKDPQFLSALETIRKRLRCFD